MPEMLRVLLADDEASLWLPLLKAPLARKGIALLSESDPNKVAKQVAKHQPDAVLLDVLFVDKDGTSRPLGRDILAALRDLYPDLPVVMFTATFADGSLQLGISDFPGAAYVFSKTVFQEYSAEQVDPYADLATCLKNAAAEREERSKLNAKLGFIIGRSPAMQNLAAALAKVARTNLPVLIVGESGTGKELIANSLCTLSQRHDRPFIKLNCGAMSDETLESALFGHEKGAFTGASEVRKGHFEAADQGTLFLDEVQNMSERLQRSLLRVLQEGVVRRMGSPVERRVEVRVLAATNEDLEKRIESGQFRADLFYRLNRVRLRVPSLRERKNDIGDLFSHFVDEANRQLGKSVSRMCRPDLLALLVSQPMAW